MFFTLSLYTYIITLFYIWYGIYLDTKYINTLPGGGVIGGGSVEMWGGRVRYNIIPLEARGVSILSFGRNACKKRKQS